MRECIGLLGKKKRSGFQVKDSSDLDREREDGWLDNRDILDILVIHSITAVSQHLNPGLKIILQCYDLRSSVVACCCRVILALVTRAICRHRYSVQRLVEAWEALFPHYTGD